MMRWLLVGVTIAALLLLGACSSTEADVRGLAAEHGVVPLGISPEAAPQAQVDLGRNLFFDPELSGNRNISCATCHHPSLATGDGLSLSIGQGGIGVGPDRITGDGGVVPRNAPDLFNRGGSEWTSMFWDGRVAGSAEEGFSTPAGDDLPEGVTSLLAAQAMFPVEAHGEMRGNPEDIDARGAPNELAMFTDDDFTSVWDGLMARLLALPEYVRLFADAYPQVAMTDLGFEHAANAIGAFEATTFHFTDSPWRSYLMGDDAALSDEAERGARLFFGDAGCAICHNGPLLSDQQFHSLAAPQIGPGKDDEAPEDHGRGRETGAAEEWYAFRTPSLLNVALTSPWFHDGAYSTLQAVIRHHADPLEALGTYDVSQAIGPGLLFVDRARYLEPLAASVDPRLASAVPALDDDQIGLLIAFLESLSDAAAVDLGHLVPDEVPSGLTVDR